MFMKLFMGRKLMLWINDVVDQGIMRDLEVELARLRGKKEQARNSDAVVAIKGGREMS